MSITTSKALQIISDHAKWTTRKSMEKRNTKLFMNGPNLKNHKFMRVEARVNLVQAFCKASHSFVMKDYMSIECGPLYGESAGESNYELREFTLKNFWEEEKINQKLKTALLKATYLNEVLITLDPNDEKQNFEFNVHGLDHVFIAEDPNDHASRAKYVISKRYYRESDLKSKIEKAGGTLNQENINNVFSQNYNNSRYGHKTDTKKVEVIEFRSKNEILFLYGADEKRALLGTIKTEHELLAYKIVYYQNGTSLLNQLESLAEKIQYFLSAQLTLIDKQLTMRTIVSDSKSPQFIKDSGSDEEILVVSDKGALNIPEVVNGSASIDSVVNTLIRMMHLISGISEEGMAGYEGAMDTAGVSIELRMDSTVRTAKDVQIWLKPLLEQMNRDYLRAMKKRYASKNLAELDDLGRVAKDDYSIKDLNGVIENKVSFVPITPRSLVNETQRIMGLINANLIPKSQARKELGYNNKEIQDATDAEFARNAITQEAIKANIPTKNKLMSPQEEINYVLENNEMPIWNIKLISKLGASHPEYIAAIDEAINSKGPEAGINLRGLRELHSNALSNIGLKNNSNNNPGDIVKKEASKVIPDSQSKENFQNNQSNNF